MKRSDGVPLRSALGAIGIVYGDIGTSVLYAFRECLAHGISAREEILGILSLIIWTLTVLVTIKYLTFVMRADNQGEGGILALLSLAFPESVKTTEMSRLTKAMIAIGVSGAALLYGDGVITPAISVLSATEGLSVAAPWLAPFTVPLTVIILLGLFAFQRNGTESVSRLFGPIMLLWFVTLAVTGIAQIVRYPGVVSAINPLHALHFLVAHRLESLVVLGSVFLVATGAETLYADLGHFGRRPIALAWHGVVFPSLLLNYLGQGALVLRDSTTHESPFFHMVPSWLVWPLIILATAATVIASQALISGDLIASTTAFGRESKLPARVPGTAVFLAGQPKGTPVPLLHNLKHNRVLHERNIVLTILTDRIPYVAKDARIEINDLSHGFFRIIAHFGFMETPTIGEVIECCAMRDFVIEEQKTSFFLGRETIVSTGKPGMARWREHLFAAMSRHAQRPAEFFKLSVNRTIELGGRVEI
jgi:K+ transporter